jgi:hypothetical protein
MNGDKCHMRVVSWQTTVSHRDQTVRYAAEVTDEACGFYSELDTVTVGMVASHMGVEEADWTFTMAMKRFVQGLRVLPNLCSPTG